MRIRWIRHDHSIPAHLRVIVVSITRANLLSRCLLPSSFFFVSCAGVVIEQFDEAWYPRRLTSRRRGSTKTKVIRLAVAVSLTTSKRTPSSSAAARAVTYPIHPYFNGRCNGFPSLVVMSKITSKIGVAINYIDWHTWSRLIRPVIWVTVATRTQDHLTVQWMWSVCQSHML